MAQLVNTIFYVLEKQPVPCTGRPNRPCIQIGKTDFGYEVLQCFEKLGVYYMCTQYVRLHYCHALS